MEAIGWQDSACFPGFAEGGICPPDAWDAGVAPSLTQPGSGNVALNAILLRRRCLSIFQYDGHCTTVGDPTGTRPAAAAATDPATNTKRLR